MSTKSTGLIEAVGFVGRGISEAIPFGDGIFDIFHIWSRFIRRSGKSWRVIRRRASQARLVNALYHWSRVATRHDPISKAKYRALRERGHSHGRALRSVADRLPAIACTMLRDQTCFDRSRKTAAAKLLQPAG